MRETLSIVLAIMLASPAAEAQSPSRTLKEQVLNISAGSAVEVRLGDMTKLRGRLGPISDDGFELQTVRGGKIDTAQIAFSQVKSIKDTTKKSFGHSVARAFLITGIVIGGIFGTFLIICRDGCIG